MTPYLSIIAAARNDNHGGDLLRRMQIFVTGLLEQCRRHALEAELILVEWNPPTDRPPLAEVLQWTSGPCRVRIITVPPEVHGRFDHSDALPLFQMIAKNVGIRAASAPFILATNVDVLFSDELMAFLAARRLRPDRMLRVDRVDVAADVPFDSGIQHQLEWCRAHVLRRNERDAIIDCRTGERHRIHWDRTWRVRLLEALQDLRLIPAVTRKRLHLTACGDFTLMHRDRWSALRGYPEMPVFSMHLDSLLCTAAHFGGAREQWLPHPIYHIEHGTGWSPQGEGQLNERLARARVPQISLEQFQRWAVEMRRDRAPMIFNDKHWGLAASPWSRPRLQKRRPHDR